MTTCIKWELLSKTAFSNSDYSYVKFVMTGFNIGFECICVCVWRGEGYRYYSLEFKILNVVLGSYVSSLPKHGKASTTKLTNKSPAQGWCLGCYANNAQS
jgi:hypothetical protein